MDNLYNFLNNFRAGVANADREVGNLLNQAGQGLSNAWSAGTAPLASAGQQIGNALNQYGQMFMLPFQSAGQQINSLGTQVGQAMANLAGQQNTQTQAQAQPAATAQPTATTAAATTTPTNTGVTYYYRDPGIDRFVNTLRFLYNPLRGITGWTPLDAMADQTGQILYGAYGKQYVPEEVKEEVKEEAKEETTEDKGEEAKTEDEDMVTYTYKPGDTFGQVIKDLGLGTGMGLWGTGGDVEYYTKQLVDQGIWPTNIPGNIPIGTTIKLKRRKI